MRVYALLLGICLLPASAWSQQPYPQNYRRAPAMAVPVRGLPNSACVAGNSVFGCAYRGYGYDRYGYGRSAYDAYEWRLIDPPDRRVYGVGSYRRAYGDPYMPVCPAVQGGVVVVSPRNPRVVPNRSGNRTYRSPSYPLVGGSYTMGCTR
jgi:hypothetical protein